MGDVAGQHDLGQALRLADQLEEQACPQDSAPEMILVDANLLIYAVNRDAHDRARGWLEKCVVRNHDRGLAMAIAACLPEYHDALEHMCVPVTP
jgi:hypothetical protein